MRDYLYPVLIGGSPHLRAVYQCQCGAAEWQQPADCYSGVGVGVQGVEEQVWELGEEGDERHKDALLSSEGGGSSREERTWV